MSIEVLVRGAAERGKFRGHRWLDRTNEVAGLSWNRSAGQMAQADVLLAPRSQPKCSPTTGTQEYFATATALRSSTDGFDVLLARASGASVVNVGDYLTFDDIDWSNSGGSDIRSEVTAISNGGGQRYTPLEYAGVLARVGSQSDGDDVYERGSANTDTLSVPLAGGGSARVEEIDVRDNESRAVMRMETSSALDSRALANYALAMRHNTSGNVWRASFAERTSVGRDGSSYIYNLRMHGDGSILPSAASGERWTIALFDERATGYNSGSGCFEFGDGTSLWSTDVLVRTPSATDFAGVMWREFSQTSTIVTQTGVITFRGTVTGGALGVNDAYLRRVRQIGDNLIVNLTDSTGMTAVSVPSGRYELLIRSRANASHLWRATLTGANTTVALDGNDAAILRSDQHTNNRFDLMVIDKLWYGLSSADLELNSDPGDYTWFACRPDYVARSTTARYRRTGGSDTPQVGFAPACDIVPWTLEDGAETRIVALARAGYSGTATSPTTGTTRIAFFQAVSPPIAAGDRVYLIGSTPTDGSDPYDTTFEVSTSRADGTSIDVAAALDLPTGTGAPADVLSYSGDLLGYSGDTLAYGTPSGGGSEVLTVQRDEDRVWLFGGNIINPRTDILPGGDLVTVGAGAVDYSAALDRRLNRGVEFRSTAGENAGAFVKALVFGKWEVDYPEGWLDGIETDAGEPFAPPFTDTDSGGEKATLRTVLDAVAERAGGETHWHVGPDRTFHWRSSITHSGLVLSKSEGLSISLTDQRDRAFNIVSTPDTDDTIVTVSDDAVIESRKAIEGGSGRYEVVRASREGNDIGEARARQHATDSLARYTFIRRLEIETVDGSATPLSDAQKALLLTLQPPTLIDYVVEHPASPDVTVTLVGQHLFVEPANAGEYLPVTFAVGRRLRFTGVTASDGKVTRDISGAGGPRGSVWCELPSGVTATVGATVSVTQVEPYMVDSVQIEVVPSGSLDFRRWRISAFQTRHSSSTPRVQDGWLGQLRASFGVD